MSEDVIFSIMTIFSAVSLTMIHENLPRNYKHKDSGEGVKLVSSANVGLDTTWEVIWIQNLLKDSLN